MKRYFIKMDGQLLAEDENGFDSFEQALSKYPELEVVECFGIKDLNTGKYNWFVSDDKSN